MLYTFLFVSFSFGQDNLITVEREAGQIPLFTIVFAVMIVILIMMLRLRMHTLGLPGRFLVLDSANDVLEKDSCFGDLFEMIEEDQVELAKEKAEEKKNEELSLKKEKRKIGNKPLEDLKKIIDKKKKTEAEVTKRREKKAVYQLTQRGDEIIQQLIEENAVDIPESKLRNVKFIAEGGNADIFLCRYGGQRVVVKKMKSTLPKENVQDFLEEMELMFRMNLPKPHPNLVQMVGCSFEPCYLVMEYFPRGSLYDILHDPRTPPLKWPVVRQFTLDIANGLEAMHTMGITHRDLKSSNIMVSINFTLKIADFSLSAPADSDNSNDSRVFGTHQWMAPEVLAHHHFTLKADIYSFAVVMWELITRQIPYRGQNILSVVSKVSLQELRPEIPKTLPSNVLPKYVELMEQAWDQDPGKRPDIQKIIKELESMPINP